jgi:Tol biopolymer transport system component
MKSLKRIALTLSLVGMLTPTINLSIGCDDSRVKNSQVKYDYDPISPTPAFQRLPKIYFSSDRDFAINDIWQMNYNGTSQENLTKNLNLQCNKLNPAISSDGKYLVFDTGITNSSGLWLYNFETNQLKNLYCPAAGEFARQPRFLKNNDIIFTYLYSGDSDICKISIQGDDLQNLTMNSSLHEETPTADPTDSSHIAFSANNQIYDAYFNDSGIFDINPVTSGTHPSFSPDGKKLAHQRTLTEKIGSTVYIADKIFTYEFAIGLSKQITTGMGHTDQNPFWTQNGIVFTTFQQAANLGEIAIMDEDGITIQDLTNDSGNDLAPCGN